MVLEMIPLRTLFCSKISYSGSVFFALRDYSRAAKPSKLNPGVQKVKGLVGLTDEEIENFDHEDMESDFMDAHEMYDEHMKEISRMKEREKFLIVRQKYFKEKFPNFLTWHDKEQIRYLHNKDPEEWSIQALSEGFPALPRIIAKIVKGNYKKKEDTIESHDKTVQKNWEDFKAGKMKDLPLELTEHLKKFTARQLIFTKFKVPEDENKIVKTITEPPGEFSQIIHSYNELKNKKNQASPDSTSRETIEDHTNQNLRFQDSRKVPNAGNTSSRHGKKVPVTFEQLKSDIKARSDQGQELSVEDRLVLSCSEKNLAKTDDSIQQTDLTDIIQNKYQKSEVAHVTKKYKDYSHLIYPEKISIPKELYKKGYTYKMNDCYYDSDGRFLYRVPGMY